MQDFSRINELDPLQILAETPVQLVVQFKRHIKESMLVLPLTTAHYHGSEMVSNQFLSVSSTV